MTTENFPIAVKKCPRSNHKFVTYVHHLADCVTDNEYFTNPSPSPSELRAAAKELAEANGLAKGGGPGTAADRDVVRKSAEHKVEMLLVYVQGEVRTKAPDAAKAAAMILSSGFSIKKTGKAPKPLFAAKHGRISSEVVLAALALKGTSMYFWEHSLDQKEWTALPATMQSRTTVSGLTPGRVYYFRFRAHGRKGMGDYSDVVKLIVL